jgi:hypothetical protein
MIRATTSDKQKLLDKQKPWLERTFSQIPEPMLGEDYTNWQDIDSIVKDAFIKVMKQP